MTYSVKLNLHRKEKKSASLNEVIVMEIQNDGEVVRGEKGQEGYRNG